MTRRLLLIRHGQTTYNATGRMQGHLDTELSEAAVAEAPFVSSWGWLAAQRHLRRFWEGSRGRDVFGGTQTEAGGGARH